MLKTLSLGREGMQKTSAMLKKATQDLMHHMVCLVQA